ncbi:MAG: rhodanese-like domain-containing protein [Desulfuromonadales bacterium]
MPRGYKELVADAETRVKSITAAEAIQMASSDATILVDLRDVRELKREGKIPGAFHCPRGLLEFWIDPQCTYHKPIFAEPKTFVFYCNLGWRSALAADIAQQMGLQDVCHIAGGFDAWKAAGGEVETK